MTGEDKEIIRNITPLLKKKNTIMLDIGAHIGAWTKRLAAIQNSNVIIVAFEPILDNFRSLQRQVGEQKNIICFQYALSDSDGISEFLIPKKTYQPSTAAVKSTADQIRNLNTLNRIEIETKRLDSISNEVMGKMKLSFIKCDVEGHELQVIKGGIETIMRFKPLIYMEILREKWANGDPSKSDVAELLLKHGYRIAEVTSEKIVHNVSNFSKQHENFLFFPNTGEYDI